MKGIQLKVQLFNIPLFIVRKSSCDMTLFQMIHAKAYFPVPLLSMIIILLVFQLIYFHIHIKNIPMKSYLSKKLFGNCAGLLSQRSQISCSFSWELGNITRNRDSFQFAICILYIFQFFIIYPDIVVHQFYAPEMSNKEGNLVLQPT